MFGGPLAGALGVKHERHLRTGDNRMAKFQKGRSGNPGGRPKVVGDMRALARSSAPEALRTLLLIMRSRRAPYTARLAAANALLDRGLGRPVAAQEDGASGQTL